MERVGVCPLKGTMFKKEMKHLPTSNRQISGDMLAGMRFSVFVPLILLSALWFHRRFMKGYTTLRINISKNDGPWKMYLRLQTWRDLGYPFVKFRKCTRAKKEGNFCFINAFSETNIAPKMMVSNRNLLFQRSMFRGYVRFREGSNCQPTTEETSLGIWMVKVNFTKAHQKGKVHLTTQCGEEGKSCSLGFLPPEN